jgi:hypothetical protein
VHAGALQRACTSISGAYAYKQIKYKGVAGDIQQASRFLITFSSPLNSGQISIWVPGRFQKIIPVPGNAVLGFPVVVRLGIPFWSCQLLFTSNMEQHKKKLRLHDASGVFQILTLDNCRVEPANNAVMIPFLLKLIT